MFCQQTKADGSHCSAKPIRGEDCCYWHSPNTKTERRKASSNGGKVEYCGNRLVEAEPIDILIDRKAIINLLADTINRVRRVKLDGSIDVKVANCIGFLSSKMMEAQREILFVERLDKIEELVKEKRDFRNDG